MRTAIAVIAIALSACSTPAAKDTSVAAADSGDICKRSTATGSNLPQRVCKSQEEWAAIERQGEENIKEFERVRDEVARPGQ